MQGVSTCNPRRRLDSLGACHRIANYCRRHHSTLHQGGRRACGVFAIHLGDGLEAQDHAGRSCSKLLHSRRTTSGFPVFIIIY